MKIAITYAELQNYVASHFHKTVNLGYVVQLAEDAELRKLGNACDEYKANVSLLLLQGTEEISHDVADGLLQVFVTYRIMHRGIILIDENDNLFTCLSSCSKSDRRSWYSACD